MLGNNGAGKTTTLRAISGFIGLDDARVTGGRIAFAGERIENQSPHANTARGIVLVPERDKVFPNLTVAENLIVATSHRANAAERRQLEALVFAFFPALTALRQRLAGLLSGGERQMLALGSAIICKPELLLVDELSLGLAPVAVEDLTRRLAGIRKNSASASCWWNRMPPWRWPSPITATYWKTAVSYWKAPLPTCAAAARFEQSYLGQASGEERRSYRALRRQETERPNG